MGTKSDIKKRNKIAMREWKRRNIFQKTFPRNRFPRNRIRKERADGCRIGERVEEKNLM